MSDKSQAGVSNDRNLSAIREVDSREWWLWGLAVAVTLVLTFGILSLTFPGLHWATDEVHSQTLKEWVRGLAALVLLFDVYTVYQHLQLQRIRRRLAEQERLFHLITEHAADMIAVVDPHGRRLYNSPAYQKILGYTPDELAATSSMEQVHPDDQARVLEAAKKAQVTGCGDRLEYRIRHKDGSWRVLESTASTIPGRDGETQGLVIVNRDITERKHAEALLEHRAFYDGLTNLPNQALFLDRLQRAIGVSRRHRDFRFAVLFIDIDQFKVVNDSLGRTLGDELLIQIARRLTACLRGSDTISREPNKDAACPPGDHTLARPGGDEFLVLAAELRDPSDAIRISERIQERLSPPFAVNGQEIVITASIGIVCSGAGRTSAEDVLRDAEIATHRAKRVGKGRCEVFDSAMQADAVNRLELETDLRKGLERDELLVYYQPLVSLQDSRIIGFEALSRWKRPQGIVSPAEFIAIADETGLILPLNRRLLFEACQQLRHWQELFPSDPPLAINVNVTAKQFAQPDLAAQIGEVLQQTGINPGCVDLEITENIAMGDAARSDVVLSELKALGVGLSIDDFGTGYSSLSRLQRFPVDTLKIDRSFISAIASDPETLEIVRIIIMLAHNLGLKVVAEGIENEQQREKLQHFGCEVGQGFLFHRPEPAPTIEELLRHQHAGMSRRRVRYGAGSQRHSTNATTISREKGKR